MPVQWFDHLFGGIKWTIELSILDLCLALSDVAVDEARGCQRYLSLL